MIILTNSMKSTKIPRSQCHRNSRRSISGYYKFFRCSSVFCCTWYELELKIMILKYRNTCTILLWLDANIGSRSDSEKTKQQLCLINDYVKFRPDLDKCVGKIFLITSGSKSIEILTSNFFSSSN